VAAFQATANKCGEMPSLRDVQVYVAGAAGAEKSIAHWQSLRKFWTDYLNNAGANLEGFLVVREIQRIQ
jgi:hypothetical protein